MPDLPSKRPDINADLVDFFRSTLDPKLAEAAVQSVYYLNPAHPRLMPKIIGAILAKKDPKEGDFQPQFVDAIIADSFNIWVDQIPVNQPFDNRGGTPWVPFDPEKVRKQDRAKAEFKRFYANFFFALQEKICGDSNKTAQFVSIGALGSTMTALLTGMGMQILYASTLITPLIILVIACGKDSFCKMKLENFFELLEEPPKDKDALNDDRVLNAPIVARRRSRPG